MLHTSTQNVNLSLRAHSVPDIHYHLCPGAFQGNLLRASRTNARARLPYPTPAHGHKTRRMGGPAAAVAHRATQGTCDTCPAATDSQQSRKHENPLLQATLKFVRLLTPPMRHAQCCTFLLPHTATQAKASTPTTQQSRATANPWLRDQWLKPYTATQCANPMRSGPHASLNSRGIQPGQIAAGTASREARRAH